MKWADIPISAKMTSAIVATLAPVLVWLFATFETTSASEAKWIQHNKAIACKTVYELKSEIRRYMEILRQSSDLPDAERDWIKQEIDILTKDIERIDPNGEC